MNLTASFPLRMLVIRSGPHALRLPNPNQFFTVSLDVSASRKSSMTHGRKFFF